MADAFDYDDNAADIFVNGSDFSRAVWAEIDASDTDDEDE